MKTWECAETKERRVSMFNLVARLFVPNPRNYMYVRAVDGNNANYTADNLERVPSRKRQATQANTKPSKIICECGGGYTL